MRSRKMVGAIVVAVAACVAGILLWWPQPAIEGGRGQEAAGGRQRMDRPHQTSLVADHPESEDLFSEPERAFLLDLVARVARLEAASGGRDPTLQIKSVQERLASLERSERLARPTRAAPSTASSPIRSLTNEITQLKREVAALKRKQDQLSSNLETTTLRAYAPRSDLASLQQKVFSLETSVRRLESRR